MSSTIPKIDPGSFPGSLTASALRDVLRESGAISRAQVISFQIEPRNLDEGIMSAYARIRPVYDRSESGAPRSIFAKYTHSDSLIGDMPRPFSSAANEVAFYTKIAAETEIPTPRCYFATADSERQRFVLLLDDLAQYRARWIDGCSLERAHLVLSEVARLHARWWGRTDAIASGLSRPPGSDPQRAAEFYRKALPVFLEKPPPGIPDSLITTARAIAPRIEELLWDLKSAPLTLVHGDCQLDNIFFGSRAGLRHRSHSPADLAFADWQLVRVAKAARDVSNFVGANLSVEMGNDDREALLGSYHSALTSFGVTNYDWAQFLADYRLSLIYRVFKIVCFVGFHILGTEAQRHKFFDVLFPRYAQEILAAKLEELF